MIADAGTIRKNRQRAIDQLVVQHIYRRNVRATAAGALVSQPL